MTYTAEEQNLITLSAITELNYKERYAALSAMMSAEPDLEACKNSLIKRCDIGVYNKVREEYSDPAFRRRILDGLEERGIECITYFSKDYPGALKQIFEPPVTLFVKGRRELLSKRCFAIVGSRKSAFYAVNGAKEFAKELSEHFTVVSGFAAGADSAALEGAEYRAVSVIAFGFDHLKTLANYSALKRVESEGLLVSEHFPTVAPQIYLFPVRNRIIAGLSAGVLVVSAGAKSGALITAEYALENNRDVFAFPYQMGVDTGIGCNNLIHDGAVLCRGVNDILGYYGFEARPQKPVELTEEERTVLAAIREEGEMFLPVLSQKLGTPAHKLIAVLSSLEIKGQVARLGGNRYSIT